MSDIRVARQIKPRMMQELLTGSDTTGMQEHQHIEWKAIWRDET